MCRADAFCRPVLIWGMPACMLSRAWGHAQPSEVGKVWFSFTAAPGKAPWTSCVPPTQVDMGACSLPSSKVV